MNIYFIAKLPYPYTNKHGIFNKYNDYYDKLTYSAYKTSTESIIYLADSIDEAFQQFTTIPDPRDRYFYPHLHSLSDYNIKIADLEILYNISKNNPELLI